MKRLGRAIAGIQFALAVVVLFANKLKSYSPPAPKPGEPAPHSWRLDLVQELQPFAGPTLFWTAILIAGSAAAKEWVPAFSYSRKTVEKLLDQYAKDHFGGRAKHHRLTLFKLSAGWKTWIRGWTRLLIRPREWKTKGAALNRIRPTGAYLYAYARTSSARNRKSPACWRVSDRPEDCEGVAGLAWETDFCTVPDLPKLKSGVLRSVTDLNGLDESDPKRTYAHRIRVSDVRVLHAMETYALHYMGAVISVKGEPWGVLLLDVEDGPCPFTATKPQGGPAGEEFRNFAHQLSHVLS